MPAPKSYVVPAHLAVTADIAPRVHALLADSRRRLSRGEYGEPDPRLLVWLRDLDRLAAESRQQRPPSTTVTEVAERWLTTLEAATRLGISERAVRNLPLTRRKIAGNLRWLESDVYEEVSTREWVLRNPAEASGAA